MSSFDHLRTFIEKKQRENNLPRKDIAYAAGISVSTLSSILKKKPQLSIQSLLGIANYFNCSIDEVLGRQDYAPNEGAVFKDIELNQAMDSLKDFIKNQLDNTQQNIHQLSDNCGLNQTTLNKFMKGDSSKVSISGSAAISLADYFKVSLDKIIGRNSIIEKTKTIENITEHPTPPSKVPKFLEGLNAADFQFIEDIRTNITSQIITPVAVNRSKTIISKDKQPTSQSIKPMYIK